MLGQVTGLTTLFGDTELSEFVEFRLLLIGVV